MSHPCGFDKHPFFPSSYIGYTAKGFARRITKNGTHGDWHAYPHEGEGSTARNVHARTLAELRDKLKEVGK